MTAPVITSSGNPVVVFRRAIETLATLGCIVELLPPNATTFSLGDQNFVIDVTATYYRRPSDASAWTIVKTPEYLNTYAMLARAHKPKTILELGIFQGGGYVFFDQLFRPDAVSAVELSAEPVAPLMRYVGARQRRHCHFGTRQDDAVLLARIVEDDLGGRLDMVVDDASHRYGPSRASFESLYPLLTPGGLYIIEDWAWAHAPLYQGSGAPYADEPALTNLLFELLMLHGSTTLVAEIRVFRTMALIRKALSGVQPAGDMWGAIRARDKALPAI